MDKIIQEEMALTDATVNSNIAVIMQEVAALIYTDVTQ
jgi:hypothetical protein